MYYVNETDEDGRTVSVGSSFTCTCFSSAFAEAKRQAASLKSISLDGVDIQKFQPVKVRFAEDVYKNISANYSDQNENFVVVTLNGNNEIIRVVTVTQGIKNLCLIHPREVFAEAIADRACAVIVAHNHTSSNLQPSSEDIAITERLIEAGNILGIKVLDHLIFNDQGFLSIFDYQERGEK